MGKLHLNLPGTPEGKLLHTEWGSFENGKTHDIEAIDGDIYVPASDAPDWKPNVPGQEEELEDMTKAELYEEAQAHDIKGRSTMDKEELVEAIEDEEA